MCRQGLGLLSWLEPPDFHQLCCYMRCDFEQLSWSLILKQNLAWMQSLNFFVMRIKRLVWTVMQVVAICSLLSHLKHVSPDLCANLFLMSFWIFFVCAGLITVTCHPSANMGLMTAHFAGWKVYPTVFLEVVGQQVHTWHIGHSLWCAPHQKHMSGNFGPLRVSNWLSVDIWVWNPNFEQWLLE